jgi:hypothetical protein
VEEAATIGTAPMAAPAGDVSVVVPSIVPVYFAQRLTTGTADGREAAEDLGTLTAVAGAQSSVG